jgi:pimeloyl-ACP methyl ester carboxylesterase
MEHRLLTYKNSQISYYCFGSGPRQVVCFHGYGEEARLYTFLEKYAGNQYTFYSFDLPFHGQTKWNEGLDFSHNNLQQIIENILLEDNQKPGTGRHPEQSEGRKLSILGFSLGGRIALSFYQSQPESVEKIILLAPDGLIVNFWYWFSTQTWIGNKIFSFSMKYPGWFFTFLKLVNKLGLVNASVFKFVNYYIGNKEARQLLYQRWTGLRKLKPNLQRIKNFIRQHKTPTRLVYGKYDRIILPVRGEKFQKGIEEFCTVTVIASGHQVLHENHVEGILAALQH